MSRTSLEQRFGVATAIGLSGTLVAMAIGQSDAMFRGDLGFVRCAGAGAFVAGFALASGFGRAGPLGWAWSAATFACATVLGAMIAVLFLPLDDFLAQFGFSEVVMSMVGSTALGPLFVAEMVTSKGAVLLPWIGSILSIHLLALWLRDRTFF